MRLWQLRRTTYLSGVSGTGIVAQGVGFDDGTCAARWLTATATTTVYVSLADVEAIHGHGGAMVLEFDEAEVEKATAEEPERIWGPMGHP